MMDELRARAANGYLEAKVRSASPVELISMLYEGLVRELRVAVSCLAKGDAAGRGMAIGHAVGILGELRGSLNHQTGGEIATNLERLYAFWTGRITEANIRSMRAPIDEVLAQLEPLRAAWDQGVLAAARGATPAQVAAISSPASPRPAAAAMLARAVGSGR
jgi:flagellar protein FliS